MFLKIIWLTIPLIIVCLSFIYMRYDNKQIKEDRNKLGYIKPKFKKLTQEQIDEIHSRGRITPAEKVKEWEDFGLCAPGDDIGSAAWRCKKFNNCHDCLVDYAKQRDEYTPFFKYLKEVLEQEVI